MLVCGGFILLFVAFSIMRYLWGQRKPIKTENANLGFHGVCFRIFSKVKQSTMHKKLSIKDVFSKYSQSSRKLQIWSHLLKKSLMENLIFLWSGSI